MSSAGAPPRGSANRPAALVRAKLGDHVKQIVLFGSQARGDATEYSDYDFLVRHAPCVRASRASGA